VDFLGGDPDRPIITGRVYTNLQKVPYKLPGSKTQSGWKSESSPGGGGFNEIRFEDAKGEEHVFIRAEKDLKKVVQNNEDVTIGNNRTKLVNANDSLTVLKNRTKMVQGSEQVKVGQSQGVAVGLNRATQVGAIDSTIVGETYCVLVSAPGEGPSDGTSLTMNPNDFIIKPGQNVFIYGQSYFEHPPIIGPPKPGDPFAPDKDNDKDKNKTGKGGIELPWGWRLENGRLVRDF